MKVKELKKENELKAVKVSPFEWINGRSWSYEFIQNNKHNFEHFLKELLPGRNISFIATPSIYINTETGSVVPTEEEISELDLSNYKCIGLETVLVASEEDFQKDIFKSKFIYLNRIDYVGLKEFTPNEISPIPGMYFRFAVYNPIKRVVSFTIDEEIYQKFITVSNKMAINKSKFIENTIKDFTSKNG